MPNIQVGTLQVVSDRGPINLLLDSVMSHRKYLDTKKKDPWGDEFDEMNSNEGKFQGESER